MIYCLDAWGFYESVNSQAASRLAPGCYLDVQDGEAELAMVLVEAVADIFKAVAMGQNIDDESYGTALLLLEEVRAWFRVWTEAESMAKKGMVLYKSLELAPNLYSPLETF